MADSELSRTHPLTIVVRTVKSLGQMVVALVAATIFATSARGTGLLAGLGFLGVALLIALVSMGFAWVNWWYFRFGVVGHDLIVLEGWLVKKRRAIPLARVQGIDIRADLTSRLLGLADVVVQTAGGGSGEAEATIGSIPLAQAEKLRTDLLHWREVEAARRTQTATGVAKAAPATEGTTTEATTTEAATPPASYVGPDPVGRMSDLRGVFGQTEYDARKSDFEYRLPFHRLLVAGLTSNAVLVAVAAAIGVTAQLAEVFGGVTQDAADAFTQLALPAMVVVVVLGLVVVVAGSIMVVVARDFGFVARRVGERLETEAGLTERRMTSLPVRRIQAVRIDQTAMRRLLGFVSVRAETAGFGRGEEQRSTTAAAVLPLARVGEVRPLRHRLLPEVEQLPDTVGLPRRARRFFVLVPTSAAALGTAALISVSAWIVASAGGPQWLTSVGPAAGVGVALLVGGAVAFLGVVAWRNSAFGADEHALAIKWGVLGRYTVRLPRSRVQSLTVRQTPFQRRAELATVVVASVSGSSASYFRVRNLDVGDAHRLAEWYSPSPRAVS